MIWIKALLISGRWVLDLFSFVYKTYILETEMSFLNVRLKYEPLRLERILNLLWWCEDFDPKISLPYPSSIIVGSASFDFWQWFSPDLSFKTQTEVVLLREFYCLSGFPDILGKIDEMVFSLFVWLFSL